MFTTRPRFTALLAACALLPALSAARSAEPITLWNANTSSAITYHPLSKDAKPGDWVYVDSRLLHPTQICLGYREVTYKAADISAMSTDPASHDAKTGLYPYLAKKDIPIIIGPDGTAYLTDGHHMLGALISSRQTDKTAFGHVVATFTSKSQAAFESFMLDPKNNDTYPFGPNGNGLTHAPDALAFSLLPKTVLSDTPSARMANDPYRSLGWGMKENGYSTKTGAPRDADILFENFIEFRWADLYRGKILWDDASDDAFYIAVANADALAHSESTTDLTGGFMAQDLPGYVPAKRAEAFTINIVNDSSIAGAIAPSARAASTLNINAKADSTLILAGKLSHLAQVAINAGGTARPSLEKGQFNPAVNIAPGSGIVVFAAESDYAGPTTIKGGALMVNGSITQSAVTVNHGGMLTGSGSVGPISGDGLVSPGSSIGILSSPSMDPAAGLKLAFKLTALGEPRYDRPLNSKNDLLVLTAPTAFKNPLTPSNEVDIYLKVDALHAGDQFSGGIFAATPSAFTDSIKAAAYHYFIADPAGAVFFGAVRYRPIEPAQFTCVVDVAPATAPFSSGPLKGYITRFTVKPAAAP